MKYSKWVKTVTALLAAMVLAGCSDAQEAAVTDEQSDDSETITFSYAFFAPAQSFPAIQMAHWAKELNERTDGRVKVDLFPGGSLLSASNMYDGVLNGVADIGLSATSYEPGRFPLINLAGSLTGQDVTSEVASRMTYQLIQEFGDQMPELDEFKVITAFTSEPAYLQTIEPVRQLEDLNGLEIRISGDNSRALDALGVTAVGMSQADAGEALQSGIIDGYAASREVLMDMQFARLAKYVTDYPLTNTIFAALMSKEKWDTLPADIQAIIEDLAPEMAAFTGQYLDQHIERSLEWAQQEEGVEVIMLSGNEASRWDDRLAPINEIILSDAEQQGLPANAFAERMRELIDEYRSETE